MKINLLLAALLTVSAAAYSQQAPLYLMYDAACMNKLDYKYRSGNANLLTTYALPLSGGSQLLLMDVGLENKKQFSTAPKQVVSCNAVPAAASLVAQINNKSRQVYIVRKRSEGNYAITPVASATWVNEQSEQVHVQGYGYAFKVNPLTSDFRENLSQMTDSSYIFLKSRETIGCKRAFKFNYEPNKACACGEVSALTLVSGLGFIAEDNSACETDKPNNGIDLVSVNGKPVNQWVEAACNPAAKSDLAVAPVVYSKQSPAPVMQNTAQKQSKTMGAPAPVMHNTSAKQAKTQGKPVQEIDYASEVRIIESAPLVVSEPIGPPPPPVYCTNVSGGGRHVVNKGETLYAISRKYGIPVKQLIAWNKLANPNHIETCQSIWVQAPQPAATKSAPAKTAVASATAKKKAVAKPASKPAPKATKPVMAAAPARKVNPAPKPVQHSTPVVEAPVTYYAATEMTPKAAPVTAPVRNAAVMHTVVAGESLYSLAKRYGYSTERFALMNGLNTDTQLQAGQVLLTTDCTCPVERAVAAESLSATQVVTQTAKSPVANETAVAEYAYYKQPVYQSATTGSTVTTTSEEVPSTYEYEQAAVIVQEQQPSSATTEPVAYSVGAPVSRETVVEYYTNTPIKTHTVTEGDSLETIARKFKTTVAQLRAWNQLEPNEVLVNGQLLVVQK